MPGSPDGGCNTCMYPYETRCHEILRFLNAKSVSIGGPLAFLACGFHIRSPNALLRCRTCRGGGRKCNGAQNEPSSETGKMVDPTTLLLARLSICSLCGSRLRKPGRLECLL